MKLRWIPALCAAVLAAGCCCGTQEAKVKDSGTNFAAEAVKPYLDSGELAGAISVLYKNGVQETACMGWANVEKKIPMSLDKMFMQCSQTKGFCGVTIAMLVEDGRISLDDPVSKYLPEFKNLKIAIRKKGSKPKIVPAKNVLTVRMVMNHTGGFPFDIKGKRGWNGFPLRATAKEAASRPLRFEPGTKAGYSNTGIDIGAAIVEVVTGKPWEVFLKERVFEPLGMKDATFKPTAEQLSRAISIYHVAPGKKAKFRSSYGPMKQPYNGPDVHPGAGAGMWITAADQLKFYKMLMNLGVGDNGVRIMKEETVKNLLATSTRPPKTGSYSLGFSVGKDGWFGHGGALGTSCMVNWKTKQLRLWVVQVTGKRSWTKSWGKAAGKFFSAKIDDSAINAYTGRTK